VSVTISGLNDAPSVTGESYQTVGNTTLEVAATQSVSGAVFLTGNLLANDSDADGPSALTGVVCDAKRGGVDDGEHGWELHVHSGGGCDFGVVHL
jgi:hypothetical protein